MLANETLNSCNGHGNKISQSLAYVSSRFNITISSAYLMGSYAYQSTDSLSDIDLIVVAEEEISPTQVRLLFSSDEPFVEVTLRSRKHFFNELTNNWSSAVKDVLIFSPSLVLQEDPFYDATCADVRKKLLDLFLYYVSDCAALARAERVRFRPIDVSRFFHFYLSLVSPEDIARTWARYERDGMHRHVVKQAEIYKHLLDEMVASGKLARSDDACYCYEASDRKSEQFLLKLLLSFIGDRVLRKKRRLVRVFGEIKNALFGQPCDTSVFEIGPVSVRFYRWMLYLRYITVLTNLCLHYRFYRRKDLDISIELPLAPKRKPLRKLFSSGYVKTRSYRKFRMLQELENAKGIFVREEKEIERFLCWLAPAWAWR